MLTREQFLDKYTAYRGESIVSTPRSKLGEIELPKNLAIHYIGQSMADIGIRGSFPLFNNWEQNIRVWHVTEGFGENGKPRPRAFPVTTARKTFFEKQKRFLRADNTTTAIMRPNELVVFDYTFHLHMTNYVEHQRKHYFRALNIITGMVSGIKDATKVGRDNLIIVNLPTLLADASDFRLAFERPTESIIADLSELGHWWIAALGSLANPKSPLNEIISDKVNMAFVDGDNVLVFNLAHVNKFADEKSPDKVLLPLLRLLTEMVESRPLPEGTIVEEATVTPAKEGDTNANTTTTTTGDNATQAEETEDADGIPSYYRRMLAEKSGLGKNQEGEINRILNAIDKMNNIPSADGESTLVERSVITADDKKLDKKLKTTARLDILPQASGESSADGLRKAGSGELMQKQIANAFLGLAKGGMVVQSYDAERVVDALNDYTVYTVQINSFPGGVSTLKIPIPNMDKDGVFQADGVLNSLDIQVVDRPIRKTKPVEAAITSYTGKLFIQRSDLAVYSYSRWLVGKIQSIGLDSSDNRITKLRSGSNGIYRDGKLSRTYTAIMPTISSFVLKGITFFFVYTERAKFFGDIDYKRYEKNNAVACGLRGKNLIIMSLDGMLHEITPEGKIQLGRIHQLIDGLGTPPRDMAVMNLGGGTLPLGFLLAYYNGFEGLLRLLKLKYRQIPASQRYMAEDTERVVTFNDVKVIVSDVDATSDLIVSAFFNHDKYTKNYRLADMRRKDVYAQLFSYFKVGSYALVIADVYRDLFLDPLTVDLLKEMKEPTELIPLLVRAAELITTDDSPDENDTLHRRFRGAERVSGFIWQQMVAARIAQLLKPNPANFPVRIQNDAIWRAMTQDTSSQLVQRLNPIHNLKEKEAVTQSGEGGRSARTLVKRSRAYHNNDLGVISEATPDSSKVGIRSYLTPNALITDASGMSTKYKRGETPSTALLSSSGLTLPGIPHDDGKRGNLANIQQSAVAPAFGYTSCPLRTGYEDVIASRVAKDFVLVADEDGEVITRNDKFIGVRYASGKKDGSRLGVIHMSCAGEYIPQRMTSLLVEGSKFKVGEVIAYNSWFFEPDFKVKTNVTMKTGAIALVAFPESSDTLEDGDACSEEWSKRLTTTVAKRATVLLSFDQEANNIAQVGDKVSADTPLCIISSMGVGSNIDDEAIKALAKLGSQSPKAEFAGEITEMEVVYMGNIDEMSPTLKAICMADNVRRKELHDAFGSGPTTGSITRSTFVGGKKVTENTVAITFYIDHDLGLANGDKISISNQLKSINGRKFQFINKAEDGRNIDIFFGAMSPQDRIVNSCFIMGATMGIMIETRNRMLDAYFGTTGTKFR